MKKETRTEYINAIKLSGNMNDNKMERFNGEVRDREKAMRGPNKTDTPIPFGYQTLHNFIRGHEDLEEKRQQKRVG
jgi:hypothetical protein